MHFNGQPRPGWDCGSIYAGNPNLNWESMSCFREQGFICKIPSGRELDDQIHGHYQGCKPGWIPFKVKFLKKGILNYLNHLNHLKMRVISIARVQIH